MGNWTIDQVMALAPDASSATSGRELSNPAKWVTAATADYVAWGEAKGSGSKPYQTAIDLREPAFKCSCPSRKFPCKHALGLFLRLAKGELGGEPIPAWVSEWLDKRDERGAKQEAKTAEAPKAVDPVAQAKRAEERWSKILAGVDECESFLQDVARQGLIAAQSARDWDAMAARMVDAQAPGLARRLKRIGNQVGVGPDWGKQVAREVGMLALLLEATKRVEAFEPLLQADVRTAVGIPAKKEALGEFVVRDHWNVMGHGVEMEDRLTIIRTWLQGQSSQKWALILAFAVPGQPLPPRLPAGQTIAAEVSFFPSSWLLRGHVESSEVVQQGEWSGQTWNEFHHDKAGVLAQSPWQEVLPVCLRGARCGDSNGAWWVVDGEGLAEPLTGANPAGLLAFTGNEPATLFGEWDGRGVRVIGAQTQEGVWNA